LRESKGSHFTRRTQFPWLLDRNASCS